MRSGPPQQSLSSDKDEERDEENIEELSPMGSNHSRCRFDRCSVRGNRGAMMEEPGMEIEPKRFLRLAKFVRSSAAAHAFRIREET